MTLREAAQQALEALKDPWSAGPEGVANAITALRAALEEDRLVHELHERLGAYAMENVSDVQSIHAGMLKEMKPNEV
jgi:hypothetical protein